ncbi:MAG: putative ABC transporter permease [Oscillospiraceae bacterium]|nr:putative ABC transporter permease [Oscillospiraceae bacterium]
MESRAIAKTPKSKLTYPVLCRYIIEFTVCGLCGWIYETLLTSYLWGEFAQRGFLHIPVLPIYGVFSFLLLPVFKKRNKVFQVFFGSIIITTVLELLSAYLIEAVLHTKLWSYSSWKYNFFGGRISLYSSLMFGILSLFLIKVVHPFVSKFAREVSEKTLSIIGSICWISILADFIISFAGQKH